MGGGIKNKQGNFWKIVIFHTNFSLPSERKVAKERCQRQNLRFSSGLQLPRDARRSPIGEWSGYRVFCVSHQRMPAPAAERLGAHTALVDRWKVGRIIPSISSNIEATALTFRGKIMYGRKLRVYKKLLSALSFFVKNQYPVSVRCQNCGFTDAARTRLRFDKQEIFKLLFDEPQGAPSQGRAVGVG